MDQVMILPRLKDGGYVFRSVCLSVCKVTQTVVNRPFSPSQSARTASPRIGSYSVYIHHRHLL